jgi:hypothetical protein
VTIQAQNPSQLSILVSLAGGTFTYYALKGTANISVSGGKIGVRATNIMMYNFQNPSDSGLLTMNIAQQ